MSSLYYIDKSDIQLDEVVFSESVGKEIERFLKEYKHREILMQYNLPLSNKILLYGKTGCGKTMTAKAIAKHLNKKLIIVNLASIISSKLGETAKNIESLFKEAQYESSVLFFDEFDSLGLIRNFDNNDNSEMKRVVNSILQLLDYLPQKSILIAATNQIEMIDEALIRRFELKLEYTNPDQKALDLYYDQLLSKYPSEFTAIERIYNCSFAEVKDYVIRRIKDNIIESQNN